MMRLKSITAISMIVVAVSLAYLGLCPPARDRVQSAARAMDFHADLQAQARARPNDPDVWLALAGTGVARECDMTAYRRLVRLRPKWDVPYLALAASLVWNAPSGRSAEYAFLYARPVKRSVLTPEQQAKLSRARAAFETARRLDPENAAPDYLLAYIALAQHRDSEALALLRSALSKPGWSLAERERGIAYYEADRRAMPDAEAGIFSSVTTYWLMPAAPLRELARIAEGMAVTAQRRGDAERAILLRESMMHLGRLVMAHGYTLIHVLCGMAVSQIVTSDKLTPQERALAVRGLREPTPGASDAVHERWYRTLRKAREAKAAAYLRAHGRADLADEIVAFEARHDAWTRNLRRVFDKDDRNMDRFVMLTAQLRQASVAGGAALGLLILWGLAWVGLTALGARSAAVTWPRWAWCVVVAVCTAVAVALSRVVPGMSEWSTFQGYSEEAAAQRWGGAIAIVVLPLLIVSCLVVTWRVRRRVPRERRPGFGRQYVGTLGAVLLPVTALALLGCATVSVPTIQVAKRLTREHKVAIYQGELASLGLKPPAGPTRGREP